MRSCPSEACVQELIGHALMAIDYAQAGKSDANDLEGAEAQRNSDRLSPSASPQSGDCAICGEGFCGASTVRAFMIYDC